MADGWELYGLTKEEVLEPHALTEYDRIEKKVADNLIELGINLSLIRTSRQYSPRLIADAGYVVNWYVIQLFMMSIVLVHRIYTDPRSDTLTIKDLKKYVLQNTRPEYQAALQALFNRSRLTSQQRENFRRIKRYRDTAVAHHRYKDLSAAEIGTGLTFEDLEDAMAALSSEYHSVRFGAAHSFEIADHPEQLARTLDLVILHSIWSTYYDEQPESWRQFWGTMLSAEELAQLSAVRVRHGRSAIEPP